MKQRLLEGEMIELAEGLKNYVLIWYNRKKRQFTLEINGGIDKKTKTYAPIRKRLKDFKNLAEV